MKPEKLFVGDTVSRNPGARKPPFGCKKTVPIMKHVLTYQLVSRIYSINSTITCRITGDMSGTMDSIAKNRRDHGPKCHHFS